MPNARLWHLAQQLRQLASATSEANALWNDQSGSQIRGRYLRPHEQSATGQVEQLRGHDGAVERVSAAVREAQVHYEEARIAGELVVREVHEAEYAVSTTHDFIRRGLTNEGRAAQRQDQAVAAAQQANAVGGAAPGEHGQRQVAITYSPLPRGAVRRGGGGGGRGGTAPYSVTDERLEKILVHHGFGVSGNVGKFAEGIGKDEIKALIAEAVERGEKGPNKDDQGNAKEGDRYEHRFDSPIGTNRKGAESSTLRVVVARGEVPTAFPI